VIALALLGLVPATSQASVSFNVTGKWVCNNRGTVVPIAGARVELWHNISYWFDDKLGSTHTASDGSFNFGVRADSNFDLYAKVVLNDDAGTSLGNWYSFSDWDTDTNVVGSHSGAVGLGTWQISKDSGRGTPKCAIWQGAHNAYGNYRQVIGARPPDSHYSISADFPCCGTPFTTTDTTRWPSGYQTGSSGDQDGGFSVNFHEFAHSVRHSFDGNFTHFLFDVGRFNYAQNHNLCSHTNNGFAFNEGWAEYWAGTLSTCTSNTADYTYEGNVATALNRLQQCSGRQTMVRVLRENPGSIHSMSEFQTKWNAIVGPRNIFLCSVAPPFGTVAVEDGFSIARLTSEVNKQIAAINKVISGLTRRMGGARRIANRVGACRGTSQCVSGIAKVADPIALNAEIQQAKLVRSRLLAGLAAARKVKFLPNFAQANLYTALTSDRRSFERANQAILINGLKSTVQTIRNKPGFNPAESTTTFKLANTRLSQLTRARNRRLLTPSSVGLIFSAPQVPTDVVRHVSG
jgi:hypothetical protein